MPDSSSQSVLCMNCFVVLKHRCLPYSITDTTQYFLLGLAPTYIYLRDVKPWGLRKELEHPDLAVGKAVTNVIWVLQTCSIMKLII